MTTKEKAVAHTALPWTYTEQTDHLNGHYVFDVFPEADLSRRVTRIDAGNYSDTPEYERAEATAAFIVPAPVTLITNCSKH